MNNSNFSTGPRLTPYEEEDTYQSSIGNADSLVYDKRYKVMQTKLHERTDFESTIKSNPIELLKEPQKYSMSYQDHQHEMTAIIDAISNLVNLKQSEDEALIDFTGYFKAGMDIFCAHLEDHLKGQNMLNKCKVSVQKEANYVRDKLMNN